MDIVLIFITICFTILGIIALVILYYYRKLYNRTRSMTDMELAEAPEPVDDHPASYEAPESTNVLNHSSEYQLSSVSSLEEMQPTVYEEDCIYQIGLDMLILDQDQEANQINILNLERRISKYIHDEIIRLNTLGYPINDVCCHASKIGRDLLTRTVEMANKMGNDYASEWLLKPNDICSICCGQLEDNITVINCGHMFDSECLCNWFKAKKPYSCPLCRSFPDSLIHYAENLPYKITCIYTETAL